MNSFEQNKNKFDRRFDFVWRLVWAWIIFVCLLVVAGIGVTIYVGVKYAGEVDKHGIKHVLNELWEGPNPNQ